MATSSFTYSDFTRFGFVDDVKYGYYDVYTQVRGNTATSDASADAYGSNSDAETFTFAQAGPRHSQSASRSIALTN